LGIVVEEYLDKREALEVGDRRLEGEDATLEIRAFEVGFVSFFGSL